jgi:3-deoxy-D-manno-octulosonic-acid transferase/heptosyltransferase-1
MKILIVKLSAIGDVVHTLPCLESLRAAYPESQITWLIEEDANEIIKGHPCLDHVLVSRRKTWIKNIFKPSKSIQTIHEIGSFIKELRRKDYDIVVDFQGLFKSGVLTRLSGSKRRVGYDKSREFSYFFLNERVLPYNQDLHAVQRYINLARYSGGKAIEPKFFIPIQEDNIKCVKKFLIENNIKEGDRIIAINPGSGWDTKLWGWERFSALSDRIIDTLDARIVLTGSENDRSLIDAISNKMQGAVCNTAGRMSLKDLAYLLSLVDLMVTTDTGPMHIASAMETPTIALFGPTAPWRTGPYGNNHTIIKSNLECSPCFKKRCDTTKCMEEITVDRVLSAVSEKLSSLENM